jgi:hypothetical protein
VAGDGLHVFVDDDAGVAVSEGAFTIAVGSPEVRRRIVLNCDAAGAEFFDVISKSHEAYLLESCGEGLVACAKTVFTSNCSIGRHFQANIFSYVAHDCRIGDFVTFAPRSSGQATGLTGAIQLNTPVKFDAFTCLNRGP